MIDGHGDDIYRYSEKILHNFSSNITVNHRIEELKQHLATCLDSITNYPEPAPVSVETRIADLTGLNGSEIMVTNGAVDAIYLIAHAMQDCRSAVLQPTFSEYTDACRINGHKVISIRSINDIPADSELVWICNPNNPTGKVIDKERLLSVIRQNRDKMFVIDQSYHHYTEKEVIAPQTCVDEGNVILLYSLTKDFAIPGLRLGYLVSNEATVSKLKEYRTPWSVNALAIAAANYLLETSSPLIDIKTLLAEASRTASRLEEMGIEVTPSDTSFMLCRLPKSTAAELKEHLVKSAGILIRDASNFEGLTTQHFRIAVQTPEENKLLTDEIESWMHS